ncbi:MAG: aminopeptidase P family protein [Tenericutes bacterium]|nr:aminopeptidase P family protein [Mycoplasmatota bacterium]
MYKKRRELYLEKIESNSLSLFFSGKAPQRSNDQNYPFSVNRNFFYLTGIDQQNVCLLIAKGEKNSACYLFIEKVDPIKALWDGAGYSFEEAAKVSDLEVKDIKDITTLDQTISQLLSTSRRALFGSIEQIYLDLERQSNLSEPTIPIQYAQKLKELYPFVQTKTNQMILAELRMVKDEDEIKKVERALAITQMGLNQMMFAMQPDKYEYQIQAEYNFVLNSNRTIPSFDTIAASGKNATVLHYVENKDQIKDGTLVLFDLGVEYEHYCSDITRVYPANGKFTKRQRDIYEVVLKANKETIKWLKPGVSFQEFLDYGKNILIEGAKQLGLIKEDEEINKYYYHSLGHYLGLDVHDVGNYSLPIPEGALITIEPGLYIEQEGIGIRIEDDVVVTSKGCINLSKDIIKEVDEIEAFMKSKS